MYSPNDDTQNYLFCRLQLMVETFGHLMNQPNIFHQQSPKLLGQHIRKRYYKTLGTSVTAHCIHIHFHNWGLKIEKNIRFINV